jgi:hypothetical protein
MCVCVGNINLNLGGFRGLLTITGSINIQGKKQKQKKKNEISKRFSFRGGEVEKLLSIVSCRVMLVKNGGVELLYSVSLFCFKFSFLIIIIT